MSLVATRLEDDLNDFSQEPGTQLSWGEEDGPDLYAINLSVFVLTLETVRVVRLGFCGWGIFFGYVHVELVFGMSVS